MIVIFEQPASLRRRETPNMEMFKPPLGLEIFFNPTFFFLLFLIFISKNKFNT